MDTSLSKNITNILHNIYKGLLIVSVIILAITSGIYSLNAVRGSLLGYLFLLTTVFLCFTEIVLGYVNSPSGSLMSLLFSIFPLLFLSLVYMSLFKIFFLNQDRIVSGNVASGYKLYTRSLVGLIILQVAILLYSFEKDVFKVKKMLDIASSSGLMLLGLLTCVNAYIINTILFFYSTDG